MAENRSSSARICPMSCSTIRSAGKTSWRLICTALPHKPNARPYLHREVATQGTHRSPQTQIQTMQIGHSRQLLEMQRKHRKEMAQRDRTSQGEIIPANNTLKAAERFPCFREMLRMENLCRLVGFDERQTATLVREERWNLVENSIPRNISANSRRLGSVCRRATDLRNMLPPDVALPSRKA